MYIHLFFVHLMKTYLTMIKHFSKEQQAYGSFNGGQIIENKPIGFPQDGGLRPYSNIFYWAHAEAQVDSTIELHPHRGFEIMSIVLKGKIKHYDTLQEKWISLEKGDVQLIKSGSGISHAEAMQKGSAIFQIWFYPDLSKTLHQEANYMDINEKTFLFENNIQTIVGKGSPIMLDSEGIKIEKIYFENGDIQIKVQEDKCYSIYLIDGNLKYNQVLLKKHDFVVITEQKDHLLFEVSEGGSLLCITSPSMTSYPMHY